MTKIKNYKELLTERSRLENDLLVRKEYMVSEFKSIKAKIDPIFNIISLFGNSNGSNGGKPSLLKLGTSVGIDVMRQTVLSKAGWFTKLVLPFVLKGISSKVIDTVQKR